MPLYVNIPPDPRSVISNDAFDDGYMAAQQGMPFTSNPYSGFMAGMWEDGFLLGLRELKGRTVSCTIPQQ